MNRLLYLAVGLAVLTACRRETRKNNPPAYLETLAADSMPAHGTTGPYDGNAWAIGEGGRLFEQMNCVGCHFHGGGGMGPALIDEKWLYGGDDADIFSSIMMGRPNGMPSFRARLTDEQAWQLVAYVRAMGGRAPSQAAPSRTDHMAVVPGPALIKNP